MRQSGSVSVADVVFVVTRGQPIIPIAYGVDLTLDLARKMADPETHEEALAEILEALAERYVYQTSADPEPIPLRERVEKELKKRFGRPGELIVNVAAVPTRPLAPRPTISASRQR